VDLDLMNCLTGIFLHVKKEKFREAIAEKPWMSIIEDIK